jgi:hypothetical protein
VIAGVGLLAAYGASVLWCGRELAQQRPSEKRLMLAITLMITLAVLAGGYLTGDMK